MHVSYVVLNIFCAALEEKSVAKVLSLISLLASYRGKNRAAFKILEKFRHFSISLP